MRIKEIIEQASNANSDYEAGKNFVKLCREHKYSRDQAKAVFIEIIGPETWFNWMWKEEKIKLEKSRITEAIEAIEAIPGDISEPIPKINKREKPDSNNITINLVHSDHSPEVTIFVAMIHAALDQLKNAKNIDDVEAIEAFSAIREAQICIEQKVFSKKLSSLF